jgi:hypothetical protein
MMQLELENVYASAYTAVNLFHYFLLSRKPGRPKSDSLLSLFGIQGIGFWSRRLFDSGNNGKKI